AFRGFFENCRPSTSGEGTESETLLYLVPDDALDELLGTLEGPPANEPDSPIFTGPVVTETIIPTYLEKVGERESSIPPEYRKLLDSNVDSALDELMGTLDGPEFALPESPDFTGPVVTETSTATNLEELGKRESTIPPKYRNLLDGKVDGKVVPPPPEEKEKTDKEKRDKLGEDENTIPPDYRLEEVKVRDSISQRYCQEMSEDDLLDALTEGFLVSPATTTKTAPLQCSASKPGAEEVVSCSKASAVQAGAPQPAKAGSQIPDDALDLLSGSLGTRELDPEDNKPLVDKVKEKATSEHIERLGDRDSTIPPEYRHLLDGKDDKSSDGAAAIDALSSDFESCATKSTEKTQQTSKVVHYLLSLYASQHFH
uniref:Calpastatin n=1 Tax=Leptobrachium leishanense TaxID=445787 RepID=A0A8C5P964_9ANUR